MLRVMNNIIIINYVRLIIYNNLCYNFVYNVYVCYLCQIFAAKYSISLQGAGELSKNKQVIPAYKLWWVVETKLIGIIVRHSNSSQM